MWKWTWHTHTHTPHWLGGSGLPRAGTRGREGPGSPWLPLLQPSCRAGECPASEEARVLASPRQGHVGCGGELQTRTGWPACGLTRRPVDRRHCPPRCSLCIRGGLPCGVEAGLTAVLQGGRPCTQPGPEVLTLESLLPGPHRLQLGLLSISRPKNQSGPCGVFSCQALPV